MPQFDVPLQASSVNDLHHLARIFHRAIPGQLRLSYGPGDFRTLPARQWIVGSDIPSKLCGDTEPHLSTSHFRQGANAQTTVHLVGQTLLAQPHFFQRACDVAVPFDRVHGQIQVSIED